MLILLIVGFLKEKINWPSYFTEKSEKQEMFAEEVVLTKKCQPNFLSPGSIKCGKEEIIQPRNQW